MPVRFEKVLQQMETETYPGDPKRRIELQRNVE